MLRGCVITAQSAEPGQRRAGAGILVKQGFSEASGGKLSLKSAVEGCEAVWIDAQLPPVLQELL